MIGLLQRVTSAHVIVDERTMGRIAAGLFVLIAVERGDSEREAARLLERVLAYRVFADAEGRMNGPCETSRGGAASGPPVHSAGGHHIKCSRWRKLRTAVPPMRGPRTK